MGRGNVGKENNRQTALIWRQTENCISAINLIWIVAETYSFKSVIDEIFEFKKFTGTKLIGSPHN